MEKYFRKLPAYYLLIPCLVWILSSLNPILPMDTPPLGESPPRDSFNRPHTTFTPQKEKSEKPYGGVQNSEFIENVKVSSCVSLGGACIDKMNEIIKKADQFVVSFMYRFNSPVLIKTLENKRLEYLDQISKNIKKDFKEKEQGPIPVIVFLDYSQTYESSSEGSRYPNYVQRLIESVPTSIVNLGGKSFHQKITISKRSGEQAVVIVGSANATSEADNEHSEDLLFIQSNALAKTYLEEFQRLMRMEPSNKRKEDSFLSEQRVKVFHENRVELDKSNIDYLSDLIKLTQPTVTDESHLETEHTGTVISLAISTGFPENEGTQKCLNVVNSILEDPNNELLLLFENFISLNDSPFTEDILNNLNNPIPKLIILDKNKHNAAALEQGYDLLLMSKLPKDKKPLNGKIYLEKENDRLKYITISMNGEVIKGVIDFKIEGKRLTLFKLKKNKSVILPQILEQHQILPLTKLNTQSNTTLLFKPFSGGKFHHKLIIQYPKTKKGLPVVYTGSFHISTNAILRNSENIIGVESESLADEHLASILLNSGLGEEPKVWKFITKHPRLLKQKKAEDSRVLKAARKLLQKCTIKMDRYFDRLTRIKDDMLEAASYFEHQDTINKYFTYYIDKFEAGKGEKKLEAIENLNKAIFSEPEDEFRDTPPIYPIYIGYLNKKWKSIQNKINDIEELPDFETMELVEWLEDMAVWIESAKEEAIAEDVSIKEEIKSIERIYMALKDMYEYEITFARLDELYGILDILSKN